MLLLAQWPAYLSYILSFLTVPIMWINRHRMLRYMRRVDNSFLLPAGLLLLFITLAPFPLRAGGIHRAPRSQDGGDGLQRRVHLYPRTTGRR
jgi:uncharacterized membrane protein